MGERGRMVSSSSIKRAVSLHGRVLVSARSPRRHSPTAAAKTPWAAHDAVACAEIRLRGLRVRSSRGLRVRSSRQDHGVAHKGAQQSGSDSGVLSNVHSLNLCLNISPAPAHASALGCWLPIAFALPTLKAPPQRQLHPFRPPRPQGLQLSRTKSIESFARLLRLCRT